MISTKLLGNKFKELWTEESPRFFRAPGRVNLIGEHTDYNDGFVLPMALNFQTIVAACSRRDSQINVYSLNYNELKSFDLNDKPHRQTNEWLNYVEGVARVLRDQNYAVGGANLLIASDVPVGAGLSSSAAIEIAAGLALTSISGTPIEPLALALTGQRAEHEYVGKPKSGIMDQFVSVFGRDEKALLIDCRALTSEEISLELGDAEFIICNSGVKHAHAEGGYNTRHAECAKAVELLSIYLPKIKALRDVGQDEFQKFAEFLPETIRRRCRHIITENARTLNAAECFKNGDLQSAGKLMDASHTSMRDDFEISCSEIDVLVALAQKFDGVYGSRMTGGGFGGCTINLVKKEKSGEFTEYIRREYKRTTSRRAEIFIVKAGNGAAEIRIPNNFSRKINLTKTKRN